VAVRPLLADDLPWVVELAEARGRQRQLFAPRFWRRAPDARNVHAGYLSPLLDDPDVVAVRTDHAFAIGLSRDGHRLVDDAEAERDDQWATEGAALLRRVAGDSSVRFVCPVSEPARAALAVELGLRRVETWWHRDLPPVPADARPEDVPVHLVPAPPVYAPGGPVLLVTDPGRDLARIEREAARRGAVVSVVTESHAGYRRTCDFFEGRLG
jgi:hypothetical protein